MSFADRSIGLSALGVLLGGAAATMIQQEIRAMGPFQLAMKHLNSNEEVKKELGL